MTETTQPGEELNQEVSPTEEAPKKEFTRTDIRFRSDVKVYFGLRKADFTDALKYTVLFSQKIFDYDVEAFVIAFAHDVNLTSLQTIIRKVNALKINKFSEEPELLIHDAEFERFVLLKNRSAEYHAAESLQQSTGDALSETVKDLGQFHLQLFKGDLLVDSADYSFYKILKD